MTDRVAMDQRSWAGVLPAVTTPFTADGAVDHALLAEHAAWLVDSGCDGVIALGSLGEGATLSFAEKVEALRTLVGAVRERGSEAARAPRPALEGAERVEALAVIRKQLAARPSIAEARSSAA